MKMRREAWSGCGSDIGSAAPTLPATKPKIAITQMDEDRSELLVRHDESRSQNHSFVVLTPRMIMAIMAKAMIKSAH